MKLYTLIKPNGFKKGDPMKFSDYACIGDSITLERDGFTIVARIEHDSDSHIDDDDCHNVDQAVTGCDEMQQAKLLEARNAWFADEWRYCGIVLSVAKNGIMLDDRAASLWRVECNYPGSDNSYLTAIANELLDEAVLVGKQAIQTLLR
jgi:hypothetical protein